PEPRTVNNAQNTPSLCIHTQHYVRNAAVWHNDQSCEFSHGPSCGGTRSICTDFMNAAIAVSEPTFARLIMCNSQNGTMGGVEHHTRSSGLFRESAVHLFGPWPK